MPTLTLYGAFKTLSHQLRLHNFPECEDAQILEAFLYVRAKIKTLRDKTELQALRNEETLQRCQQEFEFIELVVARLRTYVELTRPLTPVEMVSALSAIQLLARRLAVPYENFGTPSTPNRSEFEASLTPDVSGTGVSSGICGDGPSDVSRGLPSLLESS